MKQRYYIVIAVAAYLFFTLIITPAATVISLAEKNMRLPVKFYGVQGSIWNGRSDKMIMPGQPPIDNLQWSVNPFALLLATLSAEVLGQVHQQNIIGNVSISALGNLTASDIRARLDARQVQQMLAMPFGELAGEFNLDIESLQWNNNGLPVVQGRVNWKNARLTVVETVNLGQVEMDIRPGDDKNLQVSIQNKNGDISIEGSASLADNRNYTVDLNFSPQNNASNSIKESLAMFARRQSNGSYRLRQSGNLKQLGL